MHAENDKKLKEELDSYLKSEYDNFLNLLEKNKEISENFLIDHIQNIFTFSKDNQKTELNYAGLELTLNHLKKLANYFVENPEIFYKFTTESVRIWEGLDYDIEKFEEEKFCSIFVHLKDQQNHIIAGVRNVSPKSLRKDIDSFSKYILNKGVNPNTQEAYFKTQLINNAFVKDISLLSNLVPLINRVEKEVEIPEDMAETFMLSLEEVVRGYLNLFDDDKFLRKESYQDIVDLQTQLNSFLALCGDLEKHSFLMSMEHDLRVLIKPYYNALTKKGEDLDCEDQCILYNIIGRGTLENKMNRTSDLGDAVRAQLNLEKPKELRL